MGNCAGSHKKKTTAAAKFRQVSLSAEYDRFYVARAAKVSRNNASQSTTTSTQVSGRRLSERFEPSPSHCSHVGQESASGLASIAESYTPMIGNLRAKSKRIISHSKSARGYEKLDELVAKSKSISHSKSARGYGSRGKNSDGISQNSIRFFSPQGYGGYEMVETIQHDEAYYDYETFQEQTEFNIPRKRRDVTTGLVETASYHGVSRRDTFVSFSDMAVAVADADGA